MYIIKYNLKHTMDEKIDLIAKSIKNNFDKLRDDDCDTIKNNLLIALNDFCTKYEKDHHHVFKVKGYNKNYEGINKPDRLCKINKLDKICKINLTDYEKELKKLTKIDLSIDLHHRQDKRKDDEVFFIIIKN